MLFEGFIDFLHVALSGGTLLKCVMSQQYNYQVEMYTIFYTIFTFPENIFSLYFYHRYSGAVMNVHLWLNLINLTIFIQEKLTIVDICV